ncbi:hypothetical protein Lal_00024407 [Lupinus albus]|uniref:Putative transcription factor homeobox-WOX family n=1 Tax=Lupinus albus TaxID=3870 RepID=A0A6A5LY22_LUPAL|nr:putative transcription factor homeobox-WOX family [Lupinus albus]KAF1866396.1 hypothetical protein Lal_00024407 [Lupinus albus]
MELGLSLGDSSTPFVGFIEKPIEVSNQHGLGFNTTLSIGPIITTQRDQQEQEQEQEQFETKPNNNSISVCSVSPKNNNVMHQLDLLPRLSLPWLPPSQDAELGGCSRSFDVNTLPAAAAEDEVEEGVALSSSPNSAASPFQMDLSIYNARGGSLSGSGGNCYYNGGGGGGGGDSGGKRDSDDGDEDDNVGGSSRKKLRLSKEQSAFLEDSFKEHSTLNPKQKLALAKQLNLRPRQVEVWFQNRRARTKLKQTEMDCEYLKRCCETLTEENRRLHKELQELRALKTSKPFYMQLPATTLTMCPSCERVATNSTYTSSATPSSATNNANSGAMVTSKTSNDSKVIGFPLGKPMFQSFSAKPHTHE